MAMKKKKVVVVGYPKSGCTWLVRLVAELIQCPVTGFWGEPDNPEIAIEGTERKSDFEFSKISTINTDTKLVIIWIS